MTKWLGYGFGVLLFLFTILAAFWVIGHLRYRPIMAEATAAYDTLASRKTPAPLPFHPDMVADLPKVAQRYFNHAIAPGTPLYRSVTLAMEGDFLLGEKDAQQRYRMQARQVLSPPDAFVWIARMVKGPIRITGSDGLFDRHGWTRFWMFQSLPLVQAAATPDLDRSAAARPAIEAIWAPASLLPDAGAVWRQTGTDTADVTFGAGPEAITISLRIAPNGALQEVWTQRWSNANPAKTYRLQPFGAQITANATFAGFTVPSSVTVGNHFGTPDYLPFFIADITDATYF